MANACHAELKIAPNSPHECLLRCLRACMRVARLTIFRLDEEEAREFFAENLPTLYADTFKFNAAFSRVYTPEHHAEGYKMTVRCGGCYWRPANTVRLNTFS